MTHQLTGISSMATRQILADLASDYRRQLGEQLVFESVGGVDAAARVAAGEAFDLVVLASNAIDKLSDDGHILAGSKTDLARSAVAVAVRAGQSRPDISSARALRAAIENAPTVGFSTGPSGVALMKLLEQWGMGATLQDRLVQAPPGVPVGELIAKGQVALGFQQLSELMNLPGIDLLGPMPAECEIVTTFSGAICTVSQHPDAARSVLQYMQSSAATQIKRQNGMTPS